MCWSQTISPGTHLSLVRLLFWALPLLTSIAGDLLRSGKMLVYLIPLISNLMKHGKTAQTLRDDATETGPRVAQPRGLIIVPTHELAIEVFGLVIDLGQHTQLPTLHRVWRSISPRSKKGTPQGLRHSRSNHGQISPVYLGQISSLCRRANYLVSTNSSDDDSGRSGRTDEPSPGRRDAEAAVHNPGLSSAHSVASLNRISAKKVFRECG